MVIEKPAPPVPQGDVQITNVKQVIDVDQQMKVQDDVEIVEAAPTPNRELSYRTFFKLKSMKLFQMTSGAQWRHIHDVKDLYMAKIAFNPECNRVYIIGGAKDPKSKQTQANVSLI